MPPGARPLQKDEARAFLLDLVKFMTQISQLHADGVSAFEILLSAGFPDPITRAIMRAAAKHQEKPDAAVELPDEVQWIYDFLTAVKPFDASVTSLQRLSRALGLSFNVRVVP